MPSIAADWPDFLLISPSTASAGAIANSIAKFNIAHAIIRAPQLAPSQYRSLFAKVASLAPACQLRVHQHIDLALEFAAPLHISSAMLGAPMSQFAGIKSLSASVHSAAQQYRAAQLGVCFSLFGNIKITKSHAHTPARGFAALADMAAITAVPIYAVGGLHMEDLAIAKTHGAVGVAGIGLFAS